MNKLLSRITIDSAICHGKSCVRGLRYPVEMLLELLSSRTTIDEILADYLSHSSQRGEVNYGATMPISPTFSRASV
jgi:hypothetical protein